MRIHSLTFRGVGPYRDEQVIDFDALGSSGLYLINGPTGAGKSTVIDALCFALYGRLAGDDSDPSRLRSHFAGPNDTTEVDLVFETSAGEFRVIRSPEYLRAKKSGTGQTTAKAECKVFRRLRDGTEQEVATQIASANAELARIVGLTRDQFVQTIVLPQGQFASFLNADTREREEILKRIFDTALVEKVAEILREDAKAARASRDAMTDRITEELRLLAALIELDEAESEQLQAWALDSLDEPLTRALAELEPSLQAEVDRRDEAARQAALVASAADARRAEAKLEADAAKARDLAAERVSSAAGQAATAREALAEASELAASLDIVIDESPDPARWQARSSAAATAAGRLDALVTREAAVLAWPARNSAIEKDLDELRDRIAALADRAEALPTLIDEQEAIAGGRPTPSEVEELLRREARLAEADRLRRERDDAVALVEVLSEQAASALRTSKESDRLSREAAKAYRDGIAADLALTLTPGEPCAVCGATEHPTPAKHADIRVPLEEVESLTARASADRVAADAAHTSWKQAQIRATELTEALPMSREDWLQATSELDAEREAMAQRSEEGAAAEDLLSRIRPEATEIGTQLTEMRSQLSADTKAWEKAIQEMEEDEADVAAARGPFPSVSARAHATSALAHLLTAVADRLHDLTRAEEAQQEAEAVWADLPQHDAFGDVAAAQEAWRAADDVRADATRDAASARQQLDRYRGRVDAIARLQGERAERVASDADLLALAEVFSAGRGNDIGIHIYVLRAMFENVMELANRRLESLLNGRYRLVPADAGAGDRRSLQGLGVSVLDGFTDRVRPARSLSGGETFCVSLALALGLSDAVRLNAGGVEIGSLFIDEGFGSLDADQLDEVMVMLGHLSSDGRRVGVISHVDSMKSAIVERIDVTPAAQGRPAALRVSWMS